MVDRISKNILVDRFSQQHQFLMIACVDFYFVDIYLFNLRSASEIFYYNHFIFGLAFAVCVSDRVYRFYKYRSDGSICSIINVYIKEVYSTVDVLDIFCLVYIFCERISQFYCAGCLQLHWLSHLCVYSILESFVVLRFRFFVFSFTQDVVNLFVYLVS